jgi:hypothetical protein
LSVTLADVYHSGTLLLIASLLSNQKLSSITVEIRGALVLPYAPDGYHKNTVATLLVAA